MTTFSSDGNSVKIYVSGKLVAIIERDKLPALIYEAARALRQS
jgi:hypothetical protein